MKKVLNRIDQYLLKNHPVIWRTRIHYIAIFSTLIGNILAFTIPYLYPLTTSQLPVFNDLGFIQLTTALFMGFGVLYWGYKLSWHPFQLTSLKASMLTMSLYWLGCLSIVCNLWVFNKTVEYKIGTLIEKEQLHYDCIKIDGHLNGAIVLERSDIYFLSEKYGIDPSNMPETGTYHSTKSKIPDIPYYREANKVRSRIYFITNCEAYSDELRTRNGFKALFFLTFIGLLALPMTAMLVSLSSFIPIIGFLFIHFLYMVIVFNIGFYDSHLEEAYSVLFGIGLLGVFLAFRRISIKKILQLFLMTILPPLTFFYLANNVDEFRSYSDIVPIFSLIVISLIVALITSILTYWHQQNSLKPHS